LFSFCGHCIPLPFARWLLTPFGRRKLGAKPCLFERKSRMSGE
jgi:hypothetical protein